KRFRLRRMDFSLSLPIRYDDCDPYGHVNHASYLRYMLEAAFAASAAVGYPMQRYWEMNRAWFVRDTEIAYLAPLRYGDTVAIRTWVLDFRRVRSRRGYELRRADDGTVVAEGSTDWVFIDRESRRPASVPGDMVAAFLPDGPRPDIPPREPFPEPPPPSPGAIASSIWRRPIWTRSWSWRRGSATCAGQAQCATSRCGASPMAHCWPGRGR